MPGGRTEAHHEGTSDVRSADGHRLEHHHDALDDGLAVVVVAALLVDERVEQRPAAARLYPSLRRRERVRVRRIGGERPRARPASSGFLFALIARALRNLLRSRNVVVEPERLVARGFDQVRACPGVECRGRARLDSAEPSRRRAACGARGADRRRRDAHVPPRASASSPSPPWSRSRRARGSGRPRRLPPRPRRATAAPGAAELDLPIAAHVEALDAAAPVIVVDGDRVMLDGAVVGSASAIVKLGQAAEGRRALRAHSRRSARRGRRRTEEMRRSRALRCSACSARRRGSS